MAEEGVVAEVPSIILTATSQEDEAGLCSGNLIVSSTLILKFDLAHVVFFLDVKI